MTHTLINTGLSFPRDSALVPAFGNSSLFIIIVFFFEWIETGTISLSKCPAAIAASAFCCDLAAYSSCSCLLIVNDFAIFSAEIRIRFQESLLIP